MIAHATSDIPVEMWHCARYLVCFSWEDYKVEAELEAGPQA